MKSSLLGVWLGSASLCLIQLASHPATAMPAPDAGAGPEVERVERAAFADTAAGQAPAGVDLDGSLAGGEWRLSYRFLGTWRTGNRVGSERVEAESLIPPYVYVPETRDSSLHMLGLDWAPHERIALVIRLPVVSITERTTSPSADTHSDGIGDLNFGVLLPFMRRGEQTTSVSLTFGAPTGSIEKAVGGQRLPYPMQPGSGSWTVVPGFNYAGRDHDLSWGGQFGVVFPLNRNALDYEDGIQWRLTGWIGWSLGDAVSTSLRAEWNRWGNVGGADAGQPSPFTSPSQDSTKQGGDRLDFGPGINVRLPCCGGQRLALEALFPLYQDLEGPQLGNSWVLNAAWRWSF